MPAQSAQRISRIGQVSPFQFMMGSLSIKGVPYAVDAYRILTESSPFASLAAFNVRLPRRAFLLTD